MFNNLTNTVMKKTDSSTDFNVNQVKPEFKFANGRTSRIIDMTDEEIQDAIHFTEAFLERKAAEVAKIEKIRKFLVMEYSLRNHTPVPFRVPTEQVVIDYKHADADM